MYTARMEEAPQLQTDSPTDSDDTVSSNEILSSIRKSAVAIGDMFNDCEKRVRVIRKKVKEEIASFESLKLVPKEGTKAWLLSRKLGSKITFHAFFEAFVHEHQKEHRCYLSDRTILLNKDGAELLGYKAETRVHLLDILGRIPTLFE